MILCFCRWVSRCWKTQVSARSSMHICGQLVKFVESDDYGRPLNPKGVLGEDVGNSPLSCPCHCVSHCPVVGCVYFIFQFPVSSTVFLVTILCCALTVLTHLLWLKFCKERHVSKRLQQKIVTGLIKSKNIRSSKNYNDYRFSLLIGNDACRIMVCCRWCTYPSIHLLTTLKLSRSRSVV